MIPCLSMAWSPLEQGGTCCSLSHTHPWASPRVLLPWFVALPAQPGSLGCRWASLSTPGLSRAHPSLLEGVDVFLKLTWKYCFDRPLTAPAEPNYHLELPWDNWPHLLFKDGGGKKSSFFQTTAVEKCSGIDDVPKHIIRALNKCMMTSQVKKYFLCISDRSQPGPFKVIF